MKDINVYNSRMKKSLMDKIFFIDKVDAEVFVDFGCADGSMIKMLSELFPNYIYIGYDNKQEMIDLAKQNVANAHFYSSYDEVLEHVNLLNHKKSCLILSSVLHEIDEKETFFEFLKFKNFDFVAIRDMMYEETSANRIPFNEIYKHYPQKIKSYFENEIWHWSGQDMIQATFKSYYVENFDTEVLEDYFSFNQNHLMSLKYKHKLIPIYEYHYLLPYWKQTIKNDFGVDLNGIKTHVQIIFENVKGN